MRHYLMSMAVEALPLGMHMATPKATLVAATGGADLGAPGLR